MNHSQCRPRKHIREFRVNIPTGGEKAGTHLQEIPFDFMTQNLNESFSQLPRESEGNPCIPRRILIQKRDRVTTEKTRNSALQLRRVTLAFFDYSLTRR
ncbi:hypothetical protein CDAR_588621 [Caerostris darwini]|uniref:Uncharacterized protein n=1 Tax=Caerostris darwini TaxID=1538125 RepID=A0AAV4UV41_9ARAC|nr:hypothetical protein CDAR_588621 [Caerostris darwini]